VESEGSDPPVSLSDLIRAMYRLIEESDEADRWMEGCSNSTLSSALLAARGRLDPPEASKRWPQDVR
jgi:hypothetical protein